VLTRREGDCCGNWECVNEDYLHLSAEMQKRIARFRDLKPLPIQSSDIPLAARDVVYSRKLLSVIGLEEAPTPINVGAPISARRA